MRQLLVLDASKNSLAFLPQSIGRLEKLKQLDLFSNRLSSLPLGFSELRHLNWLDLKSNMLDSDLAKVAGTCVDARECQECAVNVGSLCSLPFLFCLSFVDLLFPYFIFLIKWPLLAALSVSFDSSVGRAEDCSGCQHWQVSLGRWFKSGSKDFFCFLIDGFCDLSCLDEIFCLSLYFAY